MAALERQGSLAGAVASIYLLPLGNFSLPLICMVQREANAPSMGVTQAHPIRAAHSPSRRQMTRKAQVTQSESMRTEAVAVSVYTREALKPGC